MGRSDRVAAAYKILKRELKEEEKEKRKKRKEKRRKRRQEEEEEEGEEREKSQHHSPEEQAPLASIKEEIGGREVGGNKSEIHSERPGSLFVSSPLTATSPSPFPLPLRSASLVQPNSPSPLLLQSASFVQPNSLSSPPGFEPDQEEERNDESLICKDIFRRGHRGGHRGGRRARARLAELAHPAIPTRRFTPCGACLDSALRGRSNGECHNAAGGGSRCERCTPAGKECQPIEPHVVPVAHRLLEALRSEDPALHKIKQLRTACRVLLDIDADEYYDGRDLRERRSMILGGWNL
ncbi:hypothetical protein F4777DRAFT_40209 [Nemania sp. FL0916]|nr:hypothetical protein F4777DRAFT_40209 [Nemania sp. FL0916]